MENYRQTNRTLSFINYHFVFCPRYKRKIFIRNDVEQRFKQLVREACEEFELVMKTVECDKDYAYLFLNAPPTLSPAAIMAKIKKVTSNKLREEFSHLEHLESLWTRDYFVSTAERISGETIKQYVNLQKSRG